METIASFNHLVKPDKVKNPDRIFCDYAQTNIQLLNQLHFAGYSEKEISYIRDIYEFGMQLFNNRFRGSGKYFLAHLVGTASILVSLRTSINVIAAGLLHAAYIYGEFGTGVTGITPEKQERVRYYLGSQTEELIARYTFLKWNRTTIPLIYRRINRLESVERDVLLIRLANELEDHLDVGVLYCGNFEYRREYIKSSLYLSVDMARQLGFPSLANTLDSSFEKVLSTSLPNSIRLVGRNHSFLLQPGSNLCNESNRLVA